jgi:hypothetical protein
VEKAKFGHKILKLVSSTKYHVVILHYNNLIVNIVTWYGAIGLINNLKLPVI